MGDYLEDLIAMRDAIEDGDTNKQHLSDAIKEITSSRDQINIGCEQLAMAEAEIKHLIKKLGDLLCQVRNLDVVPDECLECDDDIFNKQWYTGEDE